MASINIIPIEVLEKIIDLTIEDTVALRVRKEYDSEEEKLRRKILIRLALVAKDFTRPAQLALWRYMTMDHVVGVGDLIEAGFGKDKVIEELNICVNVNAPDRAESFPQLISFLRGVKKVISITRLIFFGAELPLDELFEIDSIKELNSMAVHGYSTMKVLLSPRTRLPFQLRHLTISRLSDRIDDAVSRLVISSSSTLTSIKLMSITLNQYSGSALSFVLLSLGPKLQKLEVADCDNFIVSSLLPYCTSLKSLSIYLDLDFNAEEFKLDIDTLATIPPSVILESLFIPLPRTSNLVHFPSFVRLLQTSPFSQLKRLGLYPVFKYGNDRQELVDFVRAKVDFMELLGERGISLGFGTEEEVRLEAEKEKQRTYQER